MNGNGITQEKMFAGEYMLPPRDDISHFYVLCANLFTYTHNYISMDIILKFGIQLL